MTSGIFISCMECRISRPLEAYDPELVDMVCKDCKRKKLAAVAGRRATLDALPEVQYLVQWFPAQIKEAAAEGRLHPDIATYTGDDTGQCPCPVCGMRHWADDDAEQCCLPGVERYADWVTRFELSGGNDKQLFIQQKLCEAAV